MKRKLLVRSLFYSTALTASYIIQAYFFSNLLINYYFLVALIGFVILLVELGFTIQYSPRLEPKNEIMIYATLNILLYWGFSLSFMSFTTLILQMVLCFLFFSLFFLNFYKTSILLFLTKKNTQDEFYESDLNEFTIIISYFFIFNSILSLSTVVFSNNIFTLLLIMLLALVYLILIYHYYELKLLSLVYLVISTLGIVGLIFIFYIKSFSPLLISMLATLIFVFKVQTFEIIAKYKLLKVEMFIELILVIVLGLTIVLVV